MVFLLQVKSQLYHLLVSFKHLNFDALKNYITFLWSPGEGTIAQNVKKLNPGHAIIIKNGEIYKSWQWFALQLYVISQSRQSI